MDNPLAAPEREGKFAQPPSLPAIAAGSILNPMRCPFCGEDNDKVIDSRATDAGRAIRRRRQCLACNRRFTTKEYVEENTRMTVIKKDGTRVPYDRQKLLGGLQKACYKRPVSVEALDRAVDEIEEELFRTHEREVQSVEIGRLVAQRLKALDQVAYVRFASVYKQFRDLDDLLDEVREVLESGQPDRPEQGRLF
jgi:transcriptional repressor NrdR